LAVLLEFTKHFCCRYGLIENYANGNGVLAAENLEDIAASQDTVNGTGK
jgi:hypothetical protein